MLIQDHINILKDLSQTTRPYPLVEPGSQPKNDLLMLPRSPW